MSRPRRIVINGKFLPQGMTGVHRVAHELLRALDALPADAVTRDLAFRMLTTPGAGGDSPFASLPLEAGGRLRGQAWEQIALPHMARGDLILSLCNLAPMAPRNAVTMIHDAQVFITPDSYSPQFRAWYRFVLRQAGRRHRLILTVSHFSKAQLVRFGVAPAERIAVIHNGVDHILRTDADPAAVSRLGLDRHGYAVALANTQPHKNIALLLEAFSRPELAGLKLVLIGGAGRADFEALGHGVPANVVFAGPIDDAGLRGLMEQALCLAFPSLTEGFGLPPLEAMLVGCPAVIAPCGALPEVCGRAAFVASESDPAEWAAAILQLREDPAARAERAATGMAHAAAFTWDRAARQLVAALARA